MSSQESGAPLGVDSRVSTDVVAPDAVSEPRSVSFEDVQRQGKWESAEGKTLRVDPNKLSIFDYATGEEIMFASFKAIHEHLERGGYTFLAAITETPPVTLGAQESAQGESGESAAEASTRLDQEIRESVDHAQAVIGEIGDLVTAVKNFSRKSNARKVDQAQKRVGSISSQLDEKVGLINPLIEEDETELVQLSEEVLHIDAAFVTKKKERRDKLAGIIKDLDSLSAEAKEVMDKLSSLKKGGESGVATPDSAKGTGIPGGEQAEIGSVAASNGNHKVLLKAKENAPPAPDAPVDNKAEGSPTIKTVVEQLWTEVSGLIAGLDTPKVYEAFCRGMHHVPVKGDTPAVSYFIHLDTVKKVLGGRNLDDAELQQVKGLEKRLKGRLWDQFRQIIKTGLSPQTDAAGLQIKNAPTVEALDALAQAWQEKPVINFVWEDVFNALNKEEQVVVLEYYKTAAQDLNTRLQAQRKRLEGRALRQQEKDHQDVQEKALADFLATEGERAAQTIQTFHLIVGGERNELGDLIRSKGPGLTPEQRQFMEEEMWPRVILPRLRGVLVGGLKTRHNIDEERGKLIVEAFLRTGN